MSITLFLFNMITFIKAAYGIFFISSTFYYVPLRIGLMSILFVVVYYFLGKVAKTLCHIFVLHSLVWIMQVIFCYFLEWERKKNAGIASVPEKWAK